jgi:hypothetical protein
MMAVGFKLTTVFLPMFVFFLLGLSLDIMGLDPLLKN